MDYRVVFSDVDGTLLNSRHELLPGTLQAVRALQKKGVAFVPVSARCPAGLYPLLRRHGLRCPLIAFSGAQVLDAEGKSLYFRGFDRDTAAQAISLLETFAPDCSWNLYTQDKWIVQSRSDKRIVREEGIVRAQATQGGPESLSPEDTAAKVLCLCEPCLTDEIERALRAAFPALCVVRSSDSSIEIVQGGVSKGRAVRFLLELWGIPAQAAIAFGDQHNDEEMLLSVGLPFLMGNAPAALKSRFANVTLDNDSEGILCALQGLGLVQADDL